MDTDRNLASVVRIRDIQTIDGANEIVVASVKGWKVVIRKDEFKIGDLVVYYEIDSFLPIKPEFEFLRERCYKRMWSGQEGFHLKTIKLRGQISQGILTRLPIEGTYKEGEDLTEEMGVIKYEAPVPTNLSGEVGGLFPSYIPKTDEERVQNFINRSRIDIRGKDVYITEKLDGCSFTVYIRAGKFGVCSRNYELKLNSNNSKNAFIEVSEVLKLQERFIELGRNIALQGELVGPGVQGNVYKLKNRTVYFFTGYDIDSGMRMTLGELSGILEELRLSMVPVLEYSYIIGNEGEDIIERMLEYADGKSALNTRVDREGVVVRGLSGEFSFKVISNKYLLRDKK